MAQQNKDLLLKVLCDGLPYGLICDRYGQPLELIDIDIKRELVYLQREEQELPYSLLRGDVVKPYLRDMDDMTEVEKQIYDTLIHSTSLIHRNELNIWLNKKHFNWRGLPEDMYIKVTKENNPYED